MAHSLGLTVLSHVRRLKLLIRRSCFNDVKSQQLTELRLETRMFALLWRRQVKVSLEDEENLLSGSFVSFLVPELPLCSEFSQVISWTETTSCIVKPD